MRSPLDDLEPRTAHLHMRIGPAALDRLRAAADLCQQDVTSFVLGTALDRAWDVIDREERLDRAHRIGRGRPRRGGGDAAESLGGTDPDDVNELPDPDDPDIDLWDDYRVTRQPPSLRMLAFLGLKQRRRVQREHGQPPEPALEPPPWDPPPW